MSVASVPPASSPVASLALLGSWRDFPIPRHVIRAAVLLVELEYTPHAIDAVLDYLARYGTAVGCTWSDPEHRDWIEDTLPLAPAGEWEQYEEHVFALGPEG